MPGLVGEQRVHDNLAAVGFGNAIVCRDIKDVGSIEFCREWHSYIHFRECAVCLRPGVGNTVVQFLASLLIKKLQSFR